MAKGGHVHELPVEKLGCSYEDYRLESIWFPEHTLTRDAVDNLVDTVTSINRRCRRPLRYGMFDCSIDTAWKRRFLERSIWCIIYRREIPCGFAYHYHLGAIAGQQVIHLGLLNFSARLGTDIVIATANLMAIGNLLNFGCYVGTNITHLPSIAGLLCDLCNDVYPGVTTQRTEYEKEELRQRYLPALKLLTDCYIVPILNCDASAVCDRVFRLEGSLAMINSDFVTRWDVLTRGTPPLQNQAMEALLRFQVDRLGRKWVIDDLIQLGVVDHRCFTRDVSESVLQKLAFDTPLKVLPRDYLEARLGAKIASKMYTKRL